MEKYIALLRGINVGGHKKILMTDLRSLFESLGFKEVVTYIQSGNVVFETKESNRKMLAEMIKNQIEQDFGFGVNIFVRSADDFKRILESSPFPEDNLTQLLITFFYSNPSRPKPSKNLQRPTAGRINFLSGNRKSSSTAPADMDARS